MFVYALFGSNLLSCPDAVEIGDVLLSFKDPPEAGTYKASLCFVEIFLNWPLQKSENLKNTSCAQSVNDMPVYDSISGCIGTLLFRSTLQLVTTCQKHFVVINGRW